MPNHWETQTSGYHCCFGAQLLDISLISPMFWSLQEGGFQDCNVDKVSYVYLPQEEVYIGRTYQRAMGSL